jgi:hypothetical protein
MGRGLKIFLIILGLLLIILIIFVIVTFYQVKDLMPLIQDNSTQANINELINGDCSKLPGVEAKANEIQTKLKSACLNPVLKSIILKNSPEGLDICLEVNNPSSKYLKYLEDAKTNCSKL